MKLWTVIPRTIQPKANLFSLSDYAQEFQNNALRELFSVRALFQNTLYYIGITKLHKTMIA